MSNPFTLLEPKVYTKCKSDTPYTRLERDFGGTINWDFKNVQNCQLTLYNSLSRHWVKGFVKIMIGGLSFFEGFIRSSYWSTESLVTNTLNVECLSCGVNLDAYCAKNSFKKGQCLSEVLPTANQHKLRKDYTFAFKDKASSLAAKTQEIQSRANIVCERENLESFFQDERGRFVFSALAHPKLLKRSLCILQQKVELGDMISLDILPNPLVRPFVQFSVQDNYKDFLSNKRPAQLAYVVTNSSLSFTSRQGAIQSVQAESLEYFLKKGKTAV